MAPGMPVFPMLTTMAGNSDEFRGSIDRPKSRSERLPSSPGCWVSPNRRGEMKRSSSDAILRTTAAGPSLFVDWQIFV
jgi:hypothetical protein